MEEMETQAQARRPRSRPLFHAIVYTLIGITLLLMLLPQLAGLALRQVLPNYGIGSVTVGNIDINLFDGRLAFDDLRFYRSAAQILHLQHGEIVLELSALLNKRIHIQRLSLQGFSLTAEQQLRGPTRIAGFALPAAEATQPDDSPPNESGWGVGIDTVELDDNSLQLIRPGQSLNLGVTALSAGPFYSWREDETTTLEAQLVLDEARVHINASATPLAITPGGNAELQIERLPLALLNPLLLTTATQLDGGLSTKLTLSVQQSESGTTLNHSGSISLEQLSLSLPALQLSTGPVDWQGKGNILLNESGIKAVINNGSLGVGNFTFKQPPLTVNGTTLKWQLAGGLDLPGDTINLDLNHKNLSLAQLSLKQPGFELQSKPITWQGKSKLQTSSKAVTGTVSGNLDQEGLSLSQQASNLQLKVDNVHWDGEATLSGNDGAAPAVDVQGKLLARRFSASAIGEKQPHTTLALLQLKTLSLTPPQQVDIGPIRMADLRTSITVTDKGVLPLKWHTPVKTDTSSAPGPGSENSEQPGRFRIASIRLEGNNLIHFQDRTVSPTFDLHLAPSLLALSVIDSGSPNRATPLRLDAALDKERHSTLNLEGAITPLASPPDLSLEGKLAHFEMPPLSPYLVRQIGYRINSGQLDSDIQVSIDKNVLKGEVKLTARQLDLQAEDPARIAEFEQKSSMPVNTALGLLRDDENNIQLNIPLSGQLNDPKFDFSDAINTALAKATKGAAVSYLKYLLQPYGSLITVVQLAGKVGGSIHLDPIFFAPGSSELGSEAPNYGDKLAELLGKREKLQLRLCGFATTEDLIKISDGARKEIPPEGDEKLELLARERAEAIKRMLADEHGIDPGRLYLCHPELDRSEEAKPRVDLQL